MKLLPKFIRHAFDKVYTYTLIKASGLFDEEWYTATYPQSKSFHKSPLAYYLKIGYRQKHAPSPLFSAYLYEKEHPEVSANGMNPLMHYLQYGRKKGYKCYTYNDENVVLKKKQNPLVSVIVPNYNHAAFLRKRLESIYGQTYKNIEVILLDDKSTDNSVDILLEYKERHADNTVLCVNENNSASPFSQWEKGMLMAHGDYVWIAESDDWCDANFIETLLPILDNEAVMLAFARTDFMTNGKKTWSIEQYLKEVGNGLFDRSFIMSSQQVVKAYFSKKNIIPNVSSCIFRRPVNPILFKDESWKHMKVCGDWIFYLYLIRGGYVGYSTKTTNYYRQHPLNTSVSHQKKELYYREHQLVREYLAKFYNLSVKELDWIVNDLKFLWNKNHEEFIQEQYDDLFDSHIIEQIRKDRIPNVAICSYAFSTGGGEKVPIEQANALHELGVCVTFIDCGGVFRNNEIRDELNNDIPLISLYWDFSYIRNLLIEIGVEIIHTHHASVDWAIATTKPDSIKQIVTLHGMYETIKDKYLKSNMPVLKEKIHKWLYIAEKNRDTMLRYGIKQNKLEKIYNAIMPKADIRNREDVLKECLIPKDAFIVALASRAIPEKGWQIAYDIIKEIRKKTEKDIRVLFIGDGPEYDRMHHNCEEWAVFVGFSHDVLSYLNAADVVLLPTTYSGESFPLCILESFRVHTPVIATSIGEIKDMMTTDLGVAGYIVNITSEGKLDMEDLDNGITIMLKKGEEYRQAVEAAKLVDKKYSIEKLMEILISIYRE